MDRVASVKITLAQQEKVTPISIVSHLIVVILMFRDREERYSFIVVYIYSCSGCIFAQGIIISVS